MANPSPPHAVVERQPESTVKVDEGRLTFFTLPKGEVFPLPGVDLSGDKERQVVIARGTREIYQGHPTTVLLPDGKTLFCVWSYEHGGPCGPMKRSDDGGLTWSELLPVPENWSEVRNTPSIYRLTDPQGKARLLVFAGRGVMQQAHSEDDGVTWTPMSLNGLDGVIPFSAIVPIEDGARLLALSNIRRPGETKEKKSNVIAQSLSVDGGLTWSPWRVIFDLPGLRPCEPALIRSPDGKELLCLMRENNRRRSLFAISHDEGQTWSAPAPAPVSLAGDRHVMRYAPDGRLVICFRDRVEQSGMASHFVAWVGRYDDIREGREGAYRIKLLHSHKGVDCGYPGLELLPDGTFVATTYLKYRPGKERHSVVSTRFKLAETDALLDKTSKP